jgi:cation diffusion facilitator family transporter
VSLLPDYGDTADPNVRAKYGRLEAYVGLGGNGLVFVGKLLLGLSVASMAILGDSLNHLTDMAVSAVILYSFYISSRPADEEHPYGHGRAESILAVVVSSLVISMGILVIREAASSIGDPDIDASLSTVWLMLAFTAVKIFLAVFAFAVARKIGSDAIRADGWNHISDTLISMTVAAGVAITVLLPDYKILDPMLAIGVGAFVIAVGIKLAYGSAASLMGKAPDRSTVEGIAACARSVPGVIDAHRIEVHEYGSFKAISMHIHVSESMGAGEAHDIADKVERCIMDKYRTRPLVHIDPVKRHCDECELAMIRDIAKGFPDVVSVHKATIQHANDGAVVDMHVLIDGKLSIEKGHALVHDIMSEVERRFPKHRADIHLEPCSGDCQACKETCDKRAAPPRG